jgi:hypothetical protein
MTSGIADTGGNFPYGLTIVSKFNNTGGQFAAGVKDTDGIAWGVAVFANFKWC